MNETNSGLEGAMICPLRNCLPRAGETNEYAQDGTIWHRFMQRVVEIQADEKKGLGEARDLAVAEAPDLFRDALRAIPLLALEDLDLDPARCAVEVAFAYNVRTGEARELGRGTERDYSSVTADEYAGTTDYLSLIGTDGVLIRDWKRGWSKRTPAGKNVQLKKCALDACRAYGRHFAEIEIVRLLDNGEPWYDRARLSAFDLDAFAFELEDFHARVQRDRAAYKAGDIPRAEIGDHCTYCPGLRYCQPQAMLARSVLGGDNEELQTLAIGGCALLTPENTPRIYEQVKRAEKLLEKIKTSLRLYAAQTPIPLPSGEVYGPRIDTRRSIANVALAKEILKKRLGETAAAAALSPEEMTLDGIKEARKAYVLEHPEVKKKKGAIGELDAELEKILHEAGALRKYETPTMIAHTPKVAKEAQS